MKEECKLCVQGLDLKTHRNRGKNVKLNKTLPLVKEFEVHMAKISSQASLVCAAAY